MRTLLTVACFMLNLGLVGLAMAQDLPADMLADQYLLEATEALEQEDPQRAIQAFGKIEALDTEPPVEFLFFYGKVLVEHGTTVEEVRKGGSLLKQFLLNIDKGAEQYRPALKLLSVAEKNIGKIEQREQQRAALRANPQEFLGMVGVAGGAFTMGCTEEQEDDCFGDKNPAHRVQVAAFEMGQYEVTQELWKAVMGENTSWWQKGCARCPVSGVSWKDVQEFLEQLKTLTGERYRLPTEAEWEYAARGGRESLGYKYAGSDDVDSVGWYEANSGERRHPVGEKRANELGLYDMSGNTEEWVQDCWNESYRGAPSDGSAWERGACHRRVARGGSYVSSPRYVRSTFRLDYLANKPISGFRLARTP